MLVGYTLAKIKNKFYKNRKYFPTLYSDCSSSGRTLGCSAINYACIFNIMFSELDLLEKYR